MIIIEMRKYLFTIFIAKKKRFFSCLFLLVISIVRKRNLFLDFHSYVCVLFSAMIVDICMEKKGDEIEDEFFFEFLGTTRKI